MNTIVFFLYIFKTTNSQRVRLEKFFFTPRCSCASRFSKIIVNLFHTHPGIYSGKTLSIVQCLVIWFNLDSGSCTRHEDFCYIRNSPVIWRIIKFGLVQLKPSCEVRIFYIIITNGICKPLAYMVFCHYF